jgi:hypothetical protein
MPEKAASVASSRAIFCPCHDLAGRAGACEQVQLPDGELALGEDLHHFLPDGAAGAENGYAILLHI